ncbi:MAG: EamA family transporter [Chthoniobacteraceae bacterium]
MTAGGSRTAIWRLTLATAAWGLSFPTAKAVMQAQAAAAPGHAEWFHAALILFNRMLLATVIMLALLGPRMRGLHRLELRQGLELGLFGGLGMLLQTDAQNYIAASTSAFFTQFTCVFVPLTVALRSRRMPSPLIIAACVLVMAGCAVLSGVKLGELRLGRGEWETILSAALFTGQILCLERSGFHGNDSRRTATVMFAVKGALLLAFVIAGGSAAVAGAYTSPGVLVLTVILAVVCTVYSYTTMTHWQPCVTATQAGLIYATEPVFASAWALFLPGWFSGFAGIAYANERLSWQLFAGGGLILAANLLLIARPQQPAHSEPPLA